jgi:hypothetical protein
VNEGTSGGRARHDEEVVAILCHGGDMSFCEGASSE